MMLKVYIWNIFTPILTILCSLPLCIFVSCNAFLTLKTEKKNYLENYFLPSDVYTCGLMFPVVTEQVGLV